jgi:hypothetical protein
MCALTFACRVGYNTSKLSRDDVSAVADQMRWVCRLEGHSVRTFGSFSRGAGGGVRRA